MTKVKISEDAREYIRKKDEAITIAIRTRNS